MNPLHAVLTDPWPDAPRRAFATSVAATDPPRARFTTLGLDLARALRARDRYDDWSGIEQAMMLACPPSQREVWLASLYTAVGPGPRPLVTFGRGFAEGLRIDAARFLDRAQDIYAEAPILDLTLTDLAPVADAFFDSPFTARLRSLGFGDASMTAGCVERLAASPFLGKLVWLNLYAQPCGTAGFEHLARSRNLGALAWVGGGGRDTPDVNPIAKEDEGGAYDHSPNPYAASLIERFGASKWLSGVWDRAEEPRAVALTGG